MFVRTAPREIAARWIKAGDEIATYEVANGNGDADSGLRNFCRTESFVEILERNGTADWWLVLDGARLVSPPADEAAGRIVATVHHTLGGGWDLTPADRGFVPDDLDHVGAVSFVMVPSVQGRLGEPRVYFAKDAEQFVIRERVNVDPLDFAEKTLEELESANRAGKLRLFVPPRERSEGQRVGAVSTGARFPTARVRTRNEIDAAKFSLNPWTAAAAQAYDDDEPAGAYPGLPGYRCSKLEAHPSHDWQDRKHTGHGAWYWCHGEAGPVLPKAVPDGVSGYAMGRTLPESDAVNFVSARESLDR